MRATTDDGLELDVRRMELRPGDVVVVKCDEHLPSDAFEQMVAWLTEAFPGVKCIILDGGMDIAVLEEREDGS